MADLVPCIISRQQTLTSPLESLYGYTKQGRKLSFVLVFQRRLIEDQTQTLILLTFPLQELVSYSCLWIYDAGISWVWFRMFSILVLFEMGAKFYIFRKILYPSESIAIWCSVKPTCSCFSSATDWKWRYISEGTVRAGHKTLKVMQWNPLSHYFWWNPVFY